jgi:SNF family Na+-dependent transporter
MDTSSLTDAITLAIGVITPFFVAIVRNPKWTKKQAQILSVVLAAIIGLLNVLAQGYFDRTEWTPANIIMLVVTVVGASQASYALLWKPTGIVDTVDEKSNEIIYPNDLKDAA